VCRGGYLSELEKIAGGPGYRLTSLVMLTFVLASCAKPDSTPTERASPFPEPQLSATPTSVWYGLHNATPYPNTTPLPEAVWRPVDGTYAKVDPNPPQWWACRRCADYRPAGGVWKLSFDRGIMRIFYAIPLWRSIASFETSDDRLFLFNDTTCPHEVGEYSWAIKDRSLVFTLIDDPCSFGLRAENLTRQVWPSCMPPNEMVAASDHWHKPPGCEPDRIPEPMLRGEENGIATRAYGAVANDFDTPPAVIAAANPAILPPDQGITLAASAESIPYGRNLVLWKEGDWVEVLAKSPFDAMGVQFHGDHTIGWASVLFDDEEVWRGNTSELWSDHGRHGGYIEISGFEPGTHALRVETMAIDHRPVTIEFFGFGQVQTGE